MKSVFLILGGNKGDVFKNIDAAIDEINKIIGVIIKKSSKYKTAAWGNTNQNDFINQVIELKTELKPLEVLKQILKIEEKLGRTRTEIKWEERTIDIDILFYDNDVVNEENLKIPHPFIQNRMFVLVPLNEIASDFIHPVLNAKVFELLKNCQDKLEVIKLEILKS